MKRLLLIPLAIALLWAFNPASHAQTKLRASGLSEVPNLINIQGRLTDTTGNPVADGPHSFDFSIWISLVGGNSIWNESTNATTSSGVFSHLLGSVTPFPESLFVLNDSLFLEISADGEAISPRTRLTSTPYSRVAGAILLPDNSVSAPKILDEPGIAHSFGSPAIMGGMILAIADSIVDSVIITAPTAGYVVLVATAHFQPNHTNGTKDVLVCSISKGHFSDFNYRCHASWAFALEGTQDCPVDCSITRVEPVSSGSNKYFLVARLLQGNPGRLMEYHLTAMFFPTAYGTVFIPPVEVNGGTSR